MPLPPMPLRLIVHEAPAASAVAPSGLSRALARAVGHAYAPLEADVLPPLPCSPPGAPGRVTSHGRWQDDRVRASLMALLGAGLARSLRQDFEWYLCRGAFFHNDAHFDNVLFGVWCVAGPPADIVMPRARLRLDASPGHCVVFDPFEIHGVVAPGRSEYSADDYADAPPSVFIGFELALDESVREAFGVSGAGVGPALSSGTRVSARTGAFD